MMNGMVNFRVKKENGKKRKETRWHLMLFNTNFSGKLAVEADYIDLCNVKARQLVVSAKKDQVRNADNLCTEHTIILSYHIRNYRSIESSNFDDKTEEFCPVNDDNLNNVFEDGYECFENYWNRYGIFWNLNDINAPYVSIRGLKEADFVGNCNIKQLNSDAPVVLGDIPSLQDRFDYDIHIHKLNAPYDIWNYPISEQKLQEQNCDGYKYVLCVDKPNAVIIPMSTFDHDSNTDGDEVRRIAQQVEKDKSVLDNIYLKLNASLFDDEASEAFNSFLYKMYRRFFICMLPWKEKEQSFDNIEFRLYQNNSKITKVRMVTRFCDKMLLFYYYDKDGYEYTDPQEIEVLKEALHNTIWNSLKKEDVRTEIVNKMVNFYVNKNVDQLCRVMREATKLILESDSLKNKVCLGLAGFAEKIISPSKNLSLIELCKKFISNVKQQAVSEWAKLMPKQCDIQSKKFNSEFLSYFDKNFKANEEFRRNIVQIIMKICAEEAFKILNELSPSERRILFGMLYDH